MTIEIEKETPADAGVPPYLTKSSEASGIVCAGVKTEFVDPRIVGVVANPTSSGFPAVKVWWRDDDGLHRVDVHVSATRDDADWNIERAVPAVPEDLAEAIGESAVEAFLYVVREMTPEDGLTWRSASCSDEDALDADLLMSSDEHLARERIAGATIDEAERVAHWRKVFDGVSAHLDQALELLTPTPYTPTLPSCVAADAVDAVLRPTAAAMGTALSAIEPLLELTNGKRRGDLVEDAICNILRGKGWSQADRARVLLRYRKGTTDADLRAAENAALSAERRHEAFAALAPEMARRTRR